MSEQIPEAEVASTPSKDDAAAPDGRTQEQLLADIVSNSDFIPKEESLPEEQVPEVDPESSEEVEDPKETDEPENQEVEEEAKKKISDMKWNIGCGSIILITVFTLTWQCYHAL